MPAAERRERILVFDVNETLLDLGTLEPFFARTFGDRRVLRRWFAELILYAEAFTLSSRYASFTDLAVAVLEMLASIHAVSLGPNDASELVTAMRHLPPHPDARPALGMLTDAGFRMVTLTNSPPADTSPLDNARLGDFFERQFSVDTVKRYKPAAPTYELVAQGLGVELASLRLVACHPWDTLGAAAAGCAAALVVRPGTAALGLDPGPDIVGTDLLSVAAKIIAADR